MKITEKRIKVSDLFNGYTEDEDLGVRAFGGKLDVRPPYQREFIYKDKERNAVIDSILRGRPLNVMYWAAVRDENGNLTGEYECMDGQQRTISICRYLNHDFSYNYMFIHNLKQSDPAAYQRLLDYELIVYVCDGDAGEKLDWFQTINIAGEKLTDQEMRNAIYNGPWVTDAKRRFSKRNCGAEQIAKVYLKGSAIRQDYLETVLVWACDAEGIKDINTYMAMHQMDDDAEELWVYFRRVIDWVELMFINRDKSRLRLMCGQSWGILYNKYKNINLKPQDLEKEITALIMDDDVTSQKGIYSYILDHNESHLHIRVFDEKSKQQKYAEQGGICPKCGKHFEYNEMDGDHIVPWSKGGHTTYDNLQMLCIACNRSNK